jgi:hypothetical protein
VSGQGNDRLTKAERKEQARIEREEIERKQAARKGRRTIVLVAVAIVAVLAMAALVVVPKLSESDAPATATGASASPDALLAQAADAKTTAGCSDVTNVGYYGGVSDPNSPDYLDQTHIGGQDFPQLPMLSTYPSIPPASGPHDPRALAPGVYDSPPDLGRAIHSLEHGGTIVWYDPSAPEEAIADIKAFYDRSVADVAAGQDRVIVAPFAYPDLGATGLPGGAQMALVAWHNVQTCSSPNLAVALDFTSQYAAPLQGSPPILGRTYIGEAPEAGAQM